MPLAWKKRDEPGILPRQIELPENDDEDVWPEE
jgi:hypothetical protein